MKLSLYILVAAAALAACRGQTSSTGPTLSDITGQSNGSSTASQSSASEPNIFGTSAGSSSTSSTSTTQSQTTTGVGDTSQLNSQLFGGTIDNQKAAALLKYFSSYCLQTALTQTPRTSSNAKAIALYICLMCWKSQIQNLFQGQTAATAQSSITSILGSLSQVGR